MLGIWILRELMTVETEDGARQKKKRLKKNPDDAMT
jgi:hypothetical protein